MGKLIGQLFKEDIKSTILWFILPPIAVVSFLTLSRSLGDYAILQILAGVSVSMVLIAPFIALIQVAVNDWNRFYGKNAAFYSAIPLCAGRTTIARLINYTLMGIIAAIVAFFNFWVVTALIDGGGIPLNEFVEIFNYIVEYFGGAIVFLGIVYVLVAGIMAVSQILLANTLGSTKSMSSLGNFGPILMFIVINFVTTFIFGRIQLAVAGDYVAANIQNLEANIDIAANPPLQVMIIPIIAGLVLIAAMVGLAYYLHDKKLSVK